MLKQCTYVFKTKMNKSGLTRGYTFQNAPPLHMALSLPVPGQTCLCGTVDCSFFYFKSPTVTEGLKSLPVTLASKAPISINVKRFDS